jgi:bifunctional non-homologous end joining protein LigD
MVPSEEKGETRYFLANDLAALLYLTNLGCIDENVWSSRSDDLDRPDYVFFDLDPSDGTEFTVVVDVAQAVHEELQTLQMKAYLKTSGATGFHLYVPLEREYTFEQVWTFAEIVGRIVGAKMPKQVTHQRTVAKRPPGTVMIDAYQNASGRPLAAAYAVRAFPKAPVSAPVTPRELRRSLQPEKLNIKTMLPRIKKQGDLWADFWKSRQRLEDAIGRLDLR